MPAYLFKCPECGYRAECTIRMADADTLVPVCMACAMLDDIIVGMKRVFTAPGVIFRGSG